MADVPGRAVAQAARGWIGTPFHHRACVKQVGCDCIGLVHGVWREIGGPAEIALPVYAPEGPGIGDGDVLVEGLARHFRALGGIPPTTGDVIAMRMARSGPVQHLGIITSTEDGGRFVHAYSRRGVVETRLSDHWRAHIVAAFRMPVEGA